MMQKGIQITEDDLVSTVVPVTQEVLETNKESTQTNIFIKTGQEDPFSRVKEKAEYEQKFHLVQTVNCNTQPDDWEMWLTPLTCYHCSGTLPVRAAKDYRKPYDSADEDSETP